MSLIVSVACSLSGSQPVVVAVQAQGAGDQEVHRDPDRERVP